MGGGIMSALSESEIIEENICEVENEDEYENELQNIVNEKLHKVKVEKLNDNVKEILYDLHDKLRKLLNSLQEEQEYRLSDDCIIETIEMNEYRFNENGDLE